MNDILFSQADMLRFYDEVLVPVIFAPWAKVLVDQIGEMDNSKVLDLACGPGTVTRAVLDECSLGTQVIGADNSPAMLKLARNNLPEVEFVETPAAPLSFISDSFDLVLCQQGFQYFPDKVAAAAEVKRVLRKGGRFAFSVWGHIDGAPQFSIFKKSMAAAGAPADVLKIVEAPFSWCSLRDLETLVRDSGLKVTTACSIVRNAVYPGDVSLLIAAAKAAPFGPYLLDMSLDAQRLFADSINKLTAEFRSNGNFAFPMKCNIVVGNRDRD